MTPAAPIDSTAYYHAAYVVAGTLYAAYLASLWWRARNARR